MENERREQAAPATPILDSILAKLPPPSLEHKLQIQFKVAEAARDRLFEKMEAGTLTQRDIENELSSLPAINGIDEEKVRIVHAVRLNLPEEYYYDIKRLPIE